MEACQMEAYILIFCEIFDWIALCFGLCLGLASLGLLRRDQPLPSAERLLRFAVLVPARNEEACIAGIVESVQNQIYPPELADVYVIPNNCTDQTAAAAQAAGAKILPVSETVRTKGAALQEAFLRLLSMEQYDAFCVFDADNELNPEFLAEMNRALQRERVAKSRILAKNPHEGWVCGCYEIFFCNANSLLNRPRRKLGLSARLIGTGFAVRRDLMLELGGWNAVTLTEDAEFYARLSALGEPIAFVEGAVTYDEEPLSFRQSMVQRRRWMSGIMEVAKAQLFYLLRGIRHGGGWHAADCLVQLTFAFVQAIILPVFLLRLCVEPIPTLLDLPRALATFCCSTWSIGLVSLVMEKRLTKHTFKSLLLYPVFVFSFLPLQTISLFAPNKSWKPISHTGVRM